MSDKKISQLTAATTPLDGTEVLPIVQSGDTKKVANNDLRPKQIQSNVTSGVLQVAGPATAATRVMTVPDANFSAARIDAAQSFTGDQTLTTGNLVIGTAGKGIDFSADGSAAGMTSELLDDYEEGTFTPTYVGSVTPGDTTYTTQSAKYIKVGGQVSFEIIVAWSAHSGSTGSAIVGGLPFANGSTASAVSVVPIGISLTANNVMCAYIDASASIILLRQYALTGTATLSTTSLSNSGTLILSGSYAIV